MCRGLSKTQKMIIEILNYETEHGKREWYSVGALMYQIKNGVHCFETNDVFPIEPSEVEKQSYWRAIRLLEKKGILESRKKRASWLDRLFSARGGASALKEVKLSVEFKSKILCAKHLEVEG